MRTLDDPEISGQDLSPLFGAQYVNQQLMPTTHPGQASWVWRVKTQDGSYIVRTSRYTEPPDEDFWQGAWRLFKRNPATLEGMVWADRVLTPCSPIRLPKIWRQKLYHGRPYLIVEDLSGMPLQSFNQLSQNGLVAFGAALATIHGGCQDAPITKLAPPFHVTAAPVMQYLVHRFYHQDPTCHQLWHTLAPRMAKLPKEDFWSPILLDMDPSQFLTDGCLLTAIVDTELYVMAPRHLELIGLEYLMGADEARRFRQGYESISPMPDLTPWRHTYRFLLRLLSFQGPVDWGRWMSHPSRF